MHIYIYTYVSIYVCTYEFGKGIAGDSRKMTTCVGYVVEDKKVITNGGTQCEKKSFNDTNARRRLQCYVCI